MSVGVDAVVVAVFIIIVLFLLFVLLLVLCVECVFPVTCDECLFLAHTFFDNNTKNKKKMNKKTFAKSETHFERLLQGKKRHETHKWIGGSNRTHKYYCTQQICTTHTHKMKFNFTLREKRQSPANAIKIIQITRTFDFANLFEVFFSFYILNLLSTIMSNKHLKCLNFQHT